jgi:hypothetical protein
MHPALPARLNADGESAPFAPIGVGTSRASRVHNPHASHVFREATCESVSKGKRRETARGKIPASDPFEGVKIAKLLWLSGENRGTFSEVEYLQIEEKTTDRAFDEKSCVSLD